MTDNNNIYEDNHNNSGEGGELTAVGSRYPDDKYKVLSNGAIADKKTGRIVNSKNVTSLTSEKIKQYKEREALARLQAAGEFRRGMAKGLGLDSAVKAWGKIGAAQADLAVQTDKGLSSTRAAEFVGKASGFMVKDGQNEAQTGSLTITFQSEAAKYLLDKLTNGVKTGDNSDNS